MSLHNMEEVGTSFPDVKSREMQIFEEENDANVQQKFNISTCSVCNKMQQISIYIAVNVTFKYTTDARSYRHTNFNILLKRKANVLIARQQG